MLYYPHRRRCDRFYKSEGLPLEQKVPLVGSNIRTREWPDRRWRGLRSANAVVLPCSETGIGLAADQVPPGRWSSSSQSCPERVRPDHRYPLSGCQGHRGIRQGWTVVSILGGTTVLVPPGTRVQLSGRDILGSHRIDVEPSEVGPVLKVQLIPVLGSIRIRSAAS